MLSSKIAFPARENQNVGLEPNLHEPKSDIILGEENQILARKKRDNTRIYE